MKKKKHFKVAIFGSARIHSKDPAYKLVYRLAKMIAKENMDVVTGGGPGLMQAASTGHHSGRNNKKFHSIGLTIKLPREQKTSYHLDIKKNFSQFSDRLYNFMNLADAVVVAPGGIGTALELLYAWQLSQVKHITDVPIILLGDQWKGLINWFKRSPLKADLMSKKDFEPIFFVESATDALKLLKKTKLSKEKGYKDVCKNLKN